MDTVLDVQHLVKTFVGGSWVDTLRGKKRPVYTAVNDISFSLHKNEILGFLGPNGAGKTTTIHMLLGIMTPTSGTIRFFGQDARTHHYQIAPHISFASAYVKLPGNLTVMENLDIFGQLYNLSTTQRKARIEYLLKSFGIWDLRDRLTGVLSAGQSTCVMMVKAFLPEPKILFLDEPTAALDPDIAQEIRTFILKQQREYGISILFTSHNMDEVAHICDRILILKNGKIIANNTPTQLVSTITTAHVHLIISDGFDKTVQYLRENDLHHSITDHEITIHIDEQRIAHLLGKLAQLGVVYSNISIDKPTLEDYFLNIARQR